MRARHALRLPTTLCSVLLLLALPAHQAAAVPPGFLDRPIAPGEWNQAVGITFDANGRGYVWEKAGRVWVLENDQRSVTPLIDISEEVGDWRDFGLVGFVLDPNFLANGHIYLLYTVDFHHLAHFGTPEYDPDTNEYFRDTIGRVARYTATASSDLTAVDPVSRLVLIGETVSTGFAHCHQSHGVGTMNFGDDGTLLVSAGDGASYETVDTGGNIGGSSNTALADGILRPDEDVGAFRSQLLDSLSGRVLRIDSATGDAIPSNPFYDANNPRSARSRTWVLGLRNPYRWTFRPGTGSTDPDDADPGTVYLGDVGYGEREELNIAPSGGLNMGWPLFEGLTPRPEFAASQASNANAPNPLFEIGACTQQNFFFRDLLIEDSLAAPSWPNPCDPGVQIASTADAPLWRHTRPVLDWRDFLTTRVPTFTDGTATTAVLGEPGCPVAGPGNFTGSASTGGAWYTGTRFPEAWQNSYYHGDYAGGWIKQLIFDASDRLLEVRPFVDSPAFLVDIEYNPVDDALYYISYNQFGLGGVRRISSGNAAPPIAIADATPHFGPLPLAVQFSSEGSHDPESFPLTGYSWDFGDGTPPSRLPNPTHTYTSAADITALATPVARVFSLDPPGPVGTGNPNASLWRDYAWPPVGTDDTQLQFDTFHNGEQGDGLDSDWLGYTFDSPRTLSTLIFQEGVHFDDGGWFNTVRVELRIGGVWVNATGLAVEPAYPGANDGENFEVYTFTFAPTPADGVRLIGDAGGSANFVSVGELHAFEQPADSTGPRRHDVTLGVTDADGITTQVSHIVSPNNTPPAASINSPPDGWIFCAEDPTPIDLLSTFSDAEHSPADLTFRWEPILHHNAHIHPEPIINAPQGVALIDTHGDTSDRFWFEFLFTVTDAHGLSTQVSSSIYGACCPGEHHEGPVLGPDCNLNGLPDACEGTLNDCNDNSNPDVCDSLAIASAHRFDGNSPGPFTLNGAAEIIDAAVRLTPDERLRTGSIVHGPLSAEPIGHVRVSFDFRIGGGTGADGFCFALLDAATFDTSALFAEQGPAGGGALVVQFDTYDNGEEGDNAVEIIYNGLTIARIAAPFNLDDNKVHRAVIDITGNRLTLRLTDEPPVWLPAIDSSDIPGFGPAVWLAGFGARTGGLTNEHWVDNIVLSVPGPADADGNGYPDACACRADFDGNGNVGVPDIFAFLAAWFAGNASADLDGVPGVGVPDIFAFLSIWFARCG